MRFRFEASPAEYADRREAFIKALSRQFSGFDDCLAEQLEKALPEKEPNLKYKALQQLSDRMRRAYTARVDAMLQDIAKVLDASADRRYLEKSEDGDTDGGYKTPEQQEFEEEYDPETGEPIEQEEDDDEEEDEGFVEEGEELESSKKARQELKKAGPYIGPRGGRWADPKHTIPYKEKPVSSWHSVVAMVAQAGGKITAHKTDEDKVVVKLPIKNTDKLAEIKQSLQLEDQIITGTKYSILPVPKKLMDKIAGKKKSGKKPAKSGTKSGKKPEKSGKPQPPAYLGKVQWSKPGTVDEAQQWCADLGISAEFPDVESAVDVTRALSEQHPMVLRNVQFIGTSAQLKEWAKTHPEINKESKTGSHPVDLAKDSPLGGGAIAIAHPIGPKPYTKSAIVFQSGWWSKKKAGENGAAEHAGFSLSASLADVARHELGHVEAQTMRHLEEQGKGKSMWEVWKSHCVPMLKKSKKQLISDVSQYAATNPHECWAEVSVMRRKHMPLVGWIQDAIKDMEIDSVEWTDVAATEWSKS